MKRILLPLFLFLIGYNAFAQPITTSTTTYTVPQLVQDVLFAAPPDDGGSACVGTVTNITWRTDTGTNLPNNNSIGFFQNTNPNFPISKGIIMSTGNVANAPGPNTTTQGFGATTWNGDAQLLAYLQSLAIAPATDTSKNATILEFDFTPLTNQMSFDFLFASEEYGTFQCDYSDSFAFFLKNLTTAGPTVNLALIPSTTTPVSVTTIRDNAYNSSCASKNVTFFGNYNGGANAATAATNFNGETVLMTATATVIPNNLYHIKLVIADRNDTNYDSAVFLGGGSFNIGSPTIGGVGEYAGLTSFSGPDAVCGSAQVTVQAGAVPISGVTYSWTLDGVPIVGANTYNYTMTDPGNYCVTMTYPSGCTQTDCTLVEHIPSLPIGPASDLYACPSFPHFNLTQNTAPVLNGLSTNVSYHHSLVDAQNLAAAISNPSNYVGYDGEIIYVAVEDDSSICITTTQFTLHLNACFTNPTPITPPDMIQYETVLNSGVSSFNLSSQTATVLGSYSAASYTVSYYLTQADAIAGTNPIDLSTGYLNISNPQVIYVRLHENSAPANFYGLTSFNLIVVSLPTASISGTTTICSGGNATITFNGTPNAVVTYTVDGGSNQTVTLDGSGVATLTTPLLTASSTYDLVSVSHTTIAGPTTQPLTGSAVVTVIPLPTVSISGPVAVCLGETATITFNGTPNADVTYTVDGGPNQTISLDGSGTASIITPALFVASTYALVSATTAGTPVCSQPQSGSITVSVNIPPVINNPTPYEVCDDNEDGISCLFDLSTKINEITGGTPGLMADFYETPTSGIAITANPYCNISPNTQTLYVRVYDISSPSCYSTTTLQLIVNPHPVPKPNISDYVQCDYNSPGDGVEQFILNSKDVEIANGQSGVAIGYYLTQADALSQTNPLPNVYTSGTQQIW
ncbi:hypothetical protein EZL74_00005, partial [Flavobacterium silvisoli]